MEKDHQGYYLAKNLVYYILGLLETILLFRLIFMLLGANPGSGFVAFIYSLSRIFLAPFTGIFRAFISPGIETKSVFEPATLIAMAVYALAAYGIVKLLRISEKARIK